jgi:hypothetical protein
VSSPADRTPSAASPRCKHGYVVRDDDPTVQRCIDSEARSTAHTEGRIDAVNEIMEALGVR